MSERIEYSRASDSDILTICELGQILNEVHHAARPDIFVHATSDFSRDRAHWLPSLQEENRATFLAEQEGQAVGFITAQIVLSGSPLLQPLMVANIGSV